MDEIRAAIRDVPDFPKKGIVFKDITPLLQSGTLFARAIDEMARRCKGKKIDAIAAIESRGFIFGAALALKLGVGFVPVRKKGKLPYKTVKATYTLEYGEDTIEMHQDAFRKGAQVLIVDDLLATGGTLRAVCDLVEKVGAKVAKIVCLIELSFLGAKKKFQNYDLECLIDFAGE
jgi:adenine phosphoribosyltransferase